MNLAEQLHTYEAIIGRLKKVIDPETSANVVRMRLIDGLVVDADGRVSYTFRSSSLLCPIAIFLVQQIKRAVAEVPGVKGQHVTVTDYVAAEELTKLINQET
jgi:metal-sulfur cluster biosynthetic enzyme